MINSGRRQAIPAFPAMKKYGFNIANRRNAFFLRCLILLRIFSNKTGTKIFSILKNVPKLGKIEL